ncbi:MAG: FG-GAP repeat protein [Phycisphaerales bacterium]
MRHLMPLIATAAFSLNTAPTFADLGDQLFKLLADDSAAGDLFGNSVAISGTIAIVGAYGDDDNGAASGSAYLFDTTTGRQVAKLLANDGAKGDFFGESVAISGATAIVGAWANGDNGFQSGSAYLFSTTTGQQIAKLLPKDGFLYDWFGFSVAISGATAIVGAHGDGDNGLYSGSAYFFNAATGEQIVKLLPNDGAWSDAFGISVAISGDTAIVGAPYHDHNDTRYGAAYLFDTTTGRQIAELLSDDSAQADGFGRTVAISGTTAIVGASTDGDNGTASGSAYLFDTTTGRQLFKLLPDDGAEFDFFGKSVAISGATAIVGAYLDDDNGTNSGSVYLFDTTTGWQVAKLLADDGTAFESFGIAVAISGATGKETAIVGAIGDDDFSGSAYLFDAAAPGKCPWDLDGSGSVGAADLLDLLFNWGPCKGCPADFDGSGSVAASDLLTLLANWGPCP